MRLEYKKFCSNETGRFNTEDLSADEYRALLATHRRQNRQLVKHLSEAELDEIAIGTIRSEIQHSSRVTFPSFAEFAQGLHGVTAITADETSSLEMSIA
jgi:hypothetical protein